MENKIKNYNYINRKDLRPGKELSSKIVTMVKERASMAQAKLSHRRDVWKEIDSTLNAFITPEDAQKLKERNTIRNVVIPMNYAMLQTLLTYFVMLYNQSPMFLYGAYGKEKRHVLGAELLNLEIQRQVDKASMLLNFHTQWRDNYVYGFGAVTPIWVKETTTQYQTKEIGDRTTNVENERITYVGNRLYNISPYDILPDPSVPIERVQESAFFGFIKHTNIQELIKLDAKDWRDGYVNIDYVKERFKDFGFVSPYSSDYDVKKSNMALSRYATQSTVPNRDANTASQNIDLLVMYVRIIPSDIGIGNSDKSELWTFVLCDDILIQAMPMGLDHGQIPVTIGAVDYDGYSTTPISRLEEVQSLQDTINWNFTSHVANVKKSLNGMFIVDPKFVNINDLRSPKPGKVIRMRQAGFGQDVTKAIYQLPVQDVTQNNVGNTAIMADIMRNVTAASLNASGSVEKHGERISASEANNTLRATMSRIDKDAIIFSKQAMDNMGYLLASQTIQMLDEAHWIRTNKRNYNDIKRLYDKDFDPGMMLSDYGYVEVNNKLIDINFDVICNDSNLTGMGDTNDWINLYQIIGQNPELMQQFDMFRIFEHIAKKMGAKNIEVFRRNVNQMQANTMPTEKVKSEVGKGNLVPVRGV